MTVFLKITFNINSAAGKWATLFITSLLTLPSNIMAELSIYLKHYLKKTDILSRWRNSVKNPEKWSHIIAGIFNFCEINIYFYNWDKILQNLSLSSERISDLQKSWDIPLFIYEVESSLFFTIATQASFHKSIRNLLMNRAAVELASKVPEKETRCKIVMKKVAQFSGYSSIIYKSLNVALAFMVIIFLFSGGEWGSTLTCGVIGSLVNLLAQYTIYRPASLTGDASLLAHQGTFSISSPRSPELTGERDMVMTQQNVSLLDGRAL